MKQASRLSLVALVAILAMGLVGWSLLPRGINWNEADKAQIAALSLSALPPLPADPSNRVADVPEAVTLGEALFHDKRLSANGEIACASCHLPDRAFQDDVPPGSRIGRTVRRTMPIAGTAYSPWLFWDGRKDSQWSQALGPLENPDEHGGDRLAYAHLVAREYRAQYEALFGPLPDLAGLPLHGAPAGMPETVAAWGGIAPDDQAALDLVFANIGKAIAAFERTLMPTRSRFDDYADALAAGKPAEELMSAEELAGLQIFIGKGNCTQCHNGPLLTDNHFHNTGVPEAEGLPRDPGRYAVLEAVREDPFNCLGQYSDAGPDDCAELRFMAQGDVMLRAFKTPSLRGVADRPPYMHAGQFLTLATVLAHYNRAPWAPIGVSELHRPNLSAEELSALEAFLETL